MQTVLIQALLAVISASALALVGLDQGLAALLAGACVCLPGVFVAWRFQAKPAPVDIADAGPMDVAAQSELAAGEGRTIGAALAGLITTLILMGLVFAFLKPPALGFFLTLALMQVAPLIAATLQDRRRARARREQSSADS
ncbi:MAG: hypothetical protein NXH85_08000 [Pseudomonadaceae bacterium]|nr:hypothetical protein [Pseudomonadaceae bacterium]